MPFCAAARINDAAAAAGLVEPFSIEDQLCEGVRSWLDRMTDDATGRVGYFQRGGGPARTAEMGDRYPTELSEALTAIALVLRLALPGADPAREGDRNTKAIALLRGLPPRWDGPKGSTDLYYWYYGTLAMHIVGGPAWTEWDRALTKALLLNQRQDSDVCGYRGSWDAADPWGPDGGRIYSTSMAIIALATPWRYPRLPPQRADLLQALAAKDLSAPAAARLLAAAALFRAPGADKAAAPFLKSPDPAVRAAAVLATARSGVAPTGAQAVAAALADPDLEVRRAAAGAARDLGADAAPAFDALRAALGDADPEVRARAAGALGAGGPAPGPVAEALRAAVQDPDLGVRVAAAGALARVAPDPALVVPPLVAGLGAPDPLVRAAAARHAGSLAEASNAATLAALLADPVARVRLAAAQSLVRLGKADANVVKAAASLLADPDLELRRDAVRLLLALGPAAAPAAGALGTTVLGGPRSLRLEALRALGAAGTAAVETLPAVYYCRDAGRGTLAQAAEETLARMPVPPEVAIGVLARALESQDERLVRGGISGLVVQGPAAVPPIVAILSDATRPVWGRVRAMEAVERFGAAAETAVGPLAKALDEDQDASIRLAAARALGAIGPKAAPATVVLVNHLEDKEPAVRLAVARALGTVGQASPPAVEALARVASKKAKDGEALRLEAIRALGSLGAAVGPVFDQLLLLRADEEQAVREAADGALARTAALFVDRLRQALKGSSEPHRRGAIHALARIGPEGKAAAPELGDLLEDAGNGLQDRVGEALGTMGKPAVKPLAKALKHAIASVRLAAVKALGAIGKDAASALPALKQMARTDKDMAVQMAAEQAADRIKSGR
jgi:HEAT repeat protein